MSTINPELFNLMKEKGYDVPQTGRIYIHNDMLDPDNLNDKKNDFMQLPTIADVVMWLYEKHGIWIEVYIDDNGTFGYFISKITKQYRIDSPLKRNFKSPTESYSLAIDYTLNNLI